MADHISIVLDNAHGGTYDVRAWGTYSSGGMEHLISDTDVSGGFRCRWTRSRSTLPT
jgi:hypothetical protein